MHKLRFGAAVLDLRTGMLRTAEGKDDQLTASEFGLLKLFLENPNRALHRDWLLERISGEEEPEAFDRAIDRRIMRLRRKVERDPARPMALRTVRGVGYLFDPEAVWPTLWDFGALSPRMRRAAFGQMPRFQWQRGGERMNKFKEHRSCIRPHS